MAGMWYILDHDAENVAYLYGNLIDDLVENQDWDFGKEIDWTADDPKTQALLKEAWAILADEIEGEFTEDHQKVIDQTQKEEWVLRKGEHVMKLSYSEGRILSTSEDFPMDVIERIKQESPCYKTVDSGN
ncbi:MAG: hypothetical protein CMA65_02630 [Euryarchaeota archaeon]|nr:hypothetical protein [Euryarchaeota archaeon]